jgi:DNA-binding transcriptional ArsR family regulator
MLDQLADRFKALAEPSRLAILSTLHDGELSVGELVAATRLGQANVSKHLDVLRRYGFVDRRKDGLSVIYRLSDREVFRICDVMCGPLRAVRPVARARAARPEAPRSVSRRRVARVGAPRLA